MCFLFMPYACNQVAESLHLINQNYCFSGPTGEGYFLKKKKKEPLIIFVVCLSLFFVC